MHKILFRIISIFIILSFYGCSVDQYAIEKEYWRIQKGAEAIFKNPYATPPFEFQRIVKSLDEFSNKYPDNSLSVDAKFKIARLYLLKKQYAEARSRIEQVMDFYQDSEAVQSQALFLIGSSYELEEEWGLALKQYRRIIKEYPLTIKGFDMPLYIAHHYKLKQQPQKMISEYNNAIRHYTVLAEEYQDSALGFRAYDLVARCYIALGQWDKAIESFNKIIDIFKGEEGLDSVYLNIALIYRDKLKDIPRAKAVLKGMIRDYPKSKLKKTASKIIKEME
ncbi:MAG: tetratricopeptide repeat protein [Candidatus Omnitrophota bacterium]